jgi:hypothetical protein
MCSSLALLKRTTVVGCVVFVAAGCGGSSGNPKTYSVSGTVMYLDQPLPNVAVTFYPETGRSAVGKTDSSGNFSLMTFNPNDGALAGPHKVTVVESGPKIVESAELTPNDYAPPKRKGPSSFPSKYFKPESTPLTVKIPDDLEGGKLTLKLMD